MSTDAPTSNPPNRRPLAAALTAFVRWFDADYGCADATRLRETPDRIEWLRCVPFVILHLGCLWVFIWGWSWTAVVMAVAFTSCGCLPSPVFITATFRIAVFKPRGRCSFFSV